MTLTQDANRERDALESHWIALLYWLAQQKGISVDELVESFNAEIFLNAKQRLTADSRGRAEAPWSILSYLDFGRFAEVAGHHAADLQRLGTPPRNWKALLDEQNNQRGLVKYRHHLAHGGRFGALPDAEQQQSIEMFREQRRCLESWWPQSPTDGGRRLAGSESPLRAALRELSNDPKDAASLVRSLGFRFVPNAQNLVPASLPTELARTLAGYVTGLYRVGEHLLSDGQQVGFYVAYLNEWKERSSERERERRKIAKAIVDFQSALDPRRLVLVLDSRWRSPDAELLLPRTTARGLTSTVRAVLSLDDPNHYHVELLESISLTPRLTLSDVTRRWNEAFSVERVTRRFYEEFAGLRDQLIEELLANNANNPALAGRDPAEHDFNLQLHAFGTRQLGRLLFLWFLQQKRWLGNSPGYGNPNFLIHAFRDRVDGDYFNGVLIPLFFDGLGRVSTDRRHRDVEARLGALPYLGGGLFRPGADEFERRLFGLTAEGVPTISVVLPDDLFDPAKDGVEVGTGRNRRRQRTALGLLRGYRFTTQESTPDDQSVDPDPELLGKVFENLYQADERHQTGAYYTPREVVHFMCREALDGYINEKTGVSRETIDHIRRSAIEWAEGDTWLDTATGEHIHALLDEVKILDPAVGSGAFLLASMQEIVLLKRGIEISELGRQIDPASLDVAAWKQRIAVNGLFGVDINPMAIEICHLRLWLSMLVDLNVNDFREVPALPNLDFRVVAGDSLIDRMGEKPFMQSLPRQEVQLDMALVQEVNRLQGEINTLRHRFEGEGTATGDVRRLAGLKEQIRGAQVTIARLQLDHELDLARGTLSALENPAVGRRVSQTQLRSARERVTYLERLQQGLTTDAPSQKPFLWPVHFNEVIERGGFDIVLANPPYVAMQGIDNQEEASYEHSFPEVAASRADLLVYFYARAIQMLRVGGQLAFITSNKYMRSAYGQGLRAFLPSRLQIRYVIDFGDLPVFSVAAYPAVVVGTRLREPEINQALSVADLVYPVRKRLAEQQSVVNTDNVRVELESLPDLLTEVAIQDFPQSLLRASGWILEKPTLVHLLDRLMALGTPLGEYVDGKMFRGVVTGLNPAFIIDEAARDNLMAADPRSDELIKPWLLGRDVRKWEITWSRQYVIFANRGVQIDDYPAIFEHLLAYKARLEQRATANLHPWWELQQPQEGIYQEFSSPKILWGENCPPWSLQFAFDESGYFISNKLFGITGNRELCILLNSPICLWIVDKLATKLRGGWLEMRMNEVTARIPVPKRLPNAEELSDQNVHSVVSDAYGLTNEERDAVWSWYMERSVYRSGEAQSEDVSE